MDDSAGDASVASMATLNIRNLPEEVHRRLRIRAAEHGRSMEGEARAILSEACEGGKEKAAARETTPDRVRELQAFIDKLYGGKKPKNVVEDLIAERRREAAREKTE